MMFILILELLQLSDLMLSRTQEHSYSRNLAPLLVMVIEGQESVGGKGTLAFLRLHGSLDGPDLTNQWSSPGRRKWRWRPPSCSCCSHLGRCRWQRQVHAGARRVGTSPRRPHGRWSTSSCRRIAYCRPPAAVVQHRNVCRPPCHITSSPRSWNVELFFLHFWCA